MACSKDQQPHFKHFCRICKKGFMCGRALGGHMRAHGVGDEVGSLDDEDPTSDLEGNKKMYALRTNPNRLKSCRVCENCGEEFLSWKSFLEHGKCSSDDVESSLVWLPESEADNDEDGSHHGGRSGWLKRKRSFRVCPSSEDEEDVALAKCLMELSNTRVDPMEIEQDDHPCIVTNKAEQRRSPTFSSEFLSTFTRPPPSPDKAKVFECKACKKVFNSHQALGGHRASHKNVKGCFAARNDQFDDNLADEDVITHEDFKPNTTYQLEQGSSMGSTPLVGAFGRKPKVHKCSICSRTFASGQALGGHKRCHWLTSNYTSDTTSLAKFNFHEQIEPLHQESLAIPKELELELNLNLPTFGDDTTGTTRDLQNSRTFEVSTEINLQSWSVTDKENGVGDAKDDHKHQCNNSNGDQHDHNTRTTTMENADDEGDSKAKLAKLSELKDMNNISGSSSSWLQVGIGSITDMGPDP